MKNSRSKRCGIENVEGTRINIKHWDYVQSGRREISSLEEIDRKLKSVLKLLFLHVIDPVNQASGR